LPDTSATSRTVLNDAVEAAGRWFLQSGIQEPGGGVARYHLADLDQNLPVSTEITGYSISALCYLHSRIPGDGAYLEAAIRAARFLTGEAWSDEAKVWPFELPDPSRETLAYFFDTGIIVRGLLALWRATGDREWLDAAIEGGLSLDRFRSAEDGVTMHPIVRVPSLEPLAYEPRWSRGPGCYQLKSAMALLDLGETLPDRVEFLDKFEEALQQAMDTADAFLPAETASQTMDRLHAFSYFLEALTRVADRPIIGIVLEVGIARVSVYLREIRDQFERSDVNAQLLRVRLLAAQAGAVQLNLEEAAEEVERILTFQSPEHGGFVFGSRDGARILHSNPVSTAFCLQALAMWSDFQAGTRLDPSSLI